MACWSHRDPVTRATRELRRDYSLLRDNGIPMFGVCLGHQALGEAFGATIDRAPELLHGRSSLVEHQGVGVFAGVSNPLVVGRYHSLVVEDTGLPAEFEVTARSHGLIMACVIGRCHSRACSSIRSRCSPKTGT